MVPQMKSLSRRDILRAETAGAHAALEAELGPIDSRAAYLRYLCGLYAFRSAYEAVVAACDWPLGWIGWMPTTLASALAADLADVGKVDAVERISSIAAPDIRNDIDALLGTLYVLEGSSLGARVLVGSARGLGFHGTYGARHLERQATALDNWKAFLDSLNSAPSLNMATVISSAVTTFEHARTSIRLQEHGPEAI